VNGRPVQRAPRLLVPRLLVPWYAHPAEDGWAELAVLGSRVSLVVLNARNGPADDPAYLGAAQRLVTAGLTVIGYVDTGYGRTPIRRVAADVRRWVFGYPVAGVFFDCVAAEGAMLDRYRVLARDARAAGCRLVVGNPGTTPDPGYLDLFDVTCVFESPASTYLREPDRGEPGAGPAVDPSRVCHLVHSAPAVTHRRVLARAAVSGAGHVWVSEAAPPHPWSVLPRDLARDYDLTFPAAAGLRP
jgi:Spherulation-specific family 4